MGYRSQMSAVALFLSSLMMVSFAELNSPPAGSPTNHDAELSAMIADDECHASGSNDDRKCALNALQHIAVQRAAAQHLAKKATSQHQANATANMSAGACSSVDEAKLQKFGGGNRDGTFPKISANCGHKAYSWFQFHGD